MVVGTIVSVLKNPLTENIRVARGLRQEREQFPGISGVFEFLPEALFEYVFEALSEIFFGFLKFVSGVFKAL